MSTGAGERACGLCRRYGHDDAECPSNPDNWPGLPTSAEPDAGDASERLTEAERDALAAWWVALKDGRSDLPDLADMVGRWLRDVKAAAATRARAEALREAADEYPFAGLGRDWLRVRADSLDAAPRGDGT